MANQKLQEMIPQVWKDGYEELLKNDLVIADVANQTFGADVAKQGDAIIIEIEPDIQGSSWTGGQLTSAVDVAGSTTEIKINNGYQVNFKIKRTDSIQARPTLLKATNIIKRVTYDFASIIDVALGQLYTEAGIVAADSNGDAITIDKDTAWEALVYMQMLFDQAKLPKKNRFAILDPFFCAHLTVEGKPFYTESARNNEMKNGIMSNNQVAGFTIRMSNNIYNDGAATPTYQPLFGVEKQCIGLGIQKDLEIKHYEHPDYVDDFWKGTALYGLGVYRNDKFGTMKTQYGSVIPQ